MKEKTPGGGGVGGGVKVSAVVTGRKVVFLVNLFKRLSVV